MLIALLVGFAVLWCGTDIFDGIGGGVDWEAVLTYGIMWALLALFGWVGMLVLGVITWGLYV